MLDYDDYKVKIPYPDLKDEFFYEKSLSYAPMDMEERENLYKKLANLVK